MATQKDIAAYLNISPQAVSASLGNGGGSTKVSDATRRRVLKTAQELGYVANQVARSLKSGKTHLIGVVMPYCRDPYYSALIDALSLEAVRRKYSLILQFHLFSPAEEVAAIRRLIEARVDGILIYPRGTERHYEAAHPLGKKGKTPVVALSAPFSEEPFEGVVEKDYEQEGYLAAQELLRAGHRRIDLLDAHSKSRNQRLRMKGMQAAVREAGVEARLQHVNPPPAELAAVQPEAPASLAVREELFPLLARHYLDHPGRGTAVVVNNEAVAWKLVAEAVGRGISLPDALSILSFGVLNEGDSGSLPLTALEYDPMEIAAAAFEILLDGGERRRRVRPRLVRRRSVADLRPSPVVTA
ncbi:MAG TPA: LacI family DNA-binding transcriptional regulator [Chthoniobacteraceae bacterium]|nr:LacI family DNA-binding transcriptional regulator [Chthoniobacteraceae bacterium]